MFFYLSKGTEDVRVLRLNILYLATYKMHFSKKMAKIYITQGPRCKGGASSWLMLSLILIFPRWLVLPSLTPYWYNLLKWCYCIIIIIPGSITPVKNWCFTKQEVRVGLYVVSVSSIWEHSEFLGRQLRSGARSYAECIPEYGHYKLNTYFSYWNGWCILYAAKYSTLLKIKIKNMTRS